MTPQQLVLHFLCCIVIGLCVAYPPFKNYIPNSRRVPDPCRTEIVDGKTELHYVKAVGHYGINSARNPFGLDFRRTRGNWTILCRLDSDGDGLYNGYELGDVRCMWKAYYPRSWRSLRAPFSHPGITEVFNKTSKRYEVVPQLRMALCSRRFPLI
ncbi:temptin-like [Ylistrum balloti]|uniref:temptin-like n=1 Tax=Ylistrum balloti TaxID=509963 RepID=UPI002905D8B0|nr:temptin-like [Ylistrum balloti]